MIIVPITKRIEIIKSIQVCPISQRTLIIRKMVKRKAFLAKPNRQYRVSQCGEHDCSAQSQKEYRLLRESKFDLFDG